MSNTHNGLIKRTKSHFFYGFVVCFVRLCWRRVKYGTRKDIDMFPEIYIVWVSLREWLPFVAFVSFLAFKTTNWLHEKDTTTITYRMLSKGTLFEDIQIKVSLHIQKNKIRNLQLFSPSFFFFYVFLWK